MGLNTNPYSNTPIKNLEYIQNKALVIAPFEITKSGIIDTDLMLDTPGTITMYFFRKNFNDIDKEPTAEQFKVVSTVSDISTKLGLDIADNNISSSSSSSYYLGFAEINVIFKYDKNTGIRTIEKDTSLFVEDFIDIGIDNTCNLTTEDYFVICNVTKNTKATNIGFTDTTGMDFLFMIPSSECQEIITDFDILDANNKTINVEKCDPNIGILFNNQQIDMLKTPDFFNDKSNVATYLFNDNLNDENGLYNAVGTDYQYGIGEFGKSLISTSSNTSINLGIPHKSSNILSVSFWLKWSGVNLVMPISLGDNYMGPGQSLYFRDGYVGINSHNGTDIRSGDFKGFSSSGLSGVWKHFVVEFNTGKVGKIWLDGVEQNLNATSGYFSPSKAVVSNTPVYIGINGLGNFGSIEQLRLFNRALVESEIKYLYLNSPTSIILNSPVNISRVELTASVASYDQSQFRVRDYETNNVLTTSVTLSEQIANDPDFFNDKSNVATYLFNDNLNDENGLYNAVGTDYQYGIGKFGKSLISTSSNTSINLGIPHKSSNILSVSFWLKWSGVNLVMPISLGDNYMGPGQSLYFWNNWVGINSHNGDMTGFSSNGLSSVWKHFVVEFNTGKVGKIWLDGVEQNLNATSGYFSPSKAVVSNTPVYIGINGLGNFGSIDQVRLFNRALTPKEIFYLQKETRKVIYNIEILQPTKKLKIETSQGVNYITAKTWIPQDPNKQGYRIHPVMKISDHTTEETTFNPKYYLGTKYQRNLSEILSQGIKSKRTIFNLKDMYFVDDQCIQTLKKINILLETDQMIKFTERLYQNGLKEKLNADLILEYLSTPVTGSSNNDINSILKTSLIEDYNFTQVEIDNLNDNLNTFKSRVRMNISTPVIQGSNGSLDQVKFSLPQTFIDDNRSKTEKKNLLVFGTDAGFNKFGLSGYATPYSNVTKRDATSTLDYNNLIGLPGLSGLEDISTIKDFQSSSGDWTQYILFENGNLYACRYVNPASGPAYNRDGNGFDKQSFPLKLINTNVKSMYCGYYATFIIDNNNDVWALGGYSSIGDLPYDIYGINKTNLYIQNWTKVFSSTPENTPKKIIGSTYTTWLLMESGEVFCTGTLYGYYTLDGSSMRYLKTWTSIATDVKDINCGNYHVCYTFANGDIYVGAQDNSGGLTTQGTNTTNTNTRALKILTNWIPVNRTIIQVECTHENIYYLLSNGDVYGVGRNRAGQMLSRPTTDAYGYSTPRKLYTNVKRIIPQLFGMNMNGFGSVSMVELNTGEIKAAGSTIDYKLGYYVDPNIGVTTPISLYPKVDKIFLTERNVLAIIDGKLFNSGFNRFSGTNLTDKTILEQKLNIIVSSTFKDILTNYKQQIPFSYIPLSTDINEKDKKPVFETLTNITGFSKSEIIIDLPNVL